MAIELRVPALGESITQATVGAWLKKEGDAVAADEPLVEVESEKATVALPAPAAGVLRRILKPQGTNVAVGEIIGELEAGAAAQPSRGSHESSGGAERQAMPARSGPASPPQVTPQPGGTAQAAGAGGAAAGPTGQGSAPAPAQAAAAAPAAAPGAATGAAAGTKGVPYGNVGSAAGANGASQVRAPPSVRRLMAEHGLDPSRVAGEAGVVRRGDVERALDARGAPGAGPVPVPVQAPGADGAAAKPAGPRERLVPMTPLRRTVARRLLEAQQNAAILTTFNELDMSRVLATREKHGEAFLQRHGVKLGFMSFFVKASVEALRAFPAVNGEVRGQDIVYKDHYDVGVAVGGGKGLVVPVLRDADAMTFADVEKALGELAKKARENRITMADLEGGTFTISNGGIYGSLLSTPILNPPQSGILGLHKIEKRAVVGPGDEVVVRPMMYVALSYDHRLIDGREAVSFLVRVKECIEEPERMLFDL
jgi:2-oxoglutarate dehydrogenase E2 component (dihydrolipoamide succinyltransferase)